MLNPKGKRKMVTLKEIASLKLSKKQKRKLLAKGKLRDPFEIWVDHHNHKLEIIRTCSSFIGMLVSCLVMLKVFGILK
jgi:hypothetical protein